MLMCMFKNICIVHDLQWNIWVFFLNSSPVTVSEKSYARSIFQLKKKKKKCIYALYMIYNEIYGFFLNYFPVTASEKNYARSILKPKK